MADGYQEQLQQDSPFLCSNQRLDTELLDKLVLQLNRIYPQILSDKEAQRFRSLGVPKAARLAELLVHLRGKGEEACQEFYRALHLHAEELYHSLPTRVRRREASEVNGSNSALEQKERCVLNDRGPVFFLGCFSVAVGLAWLYYYRDGKAVLGSGLRYTAFALGQRAGEVLLASSEDRTASK